MNARKSLLLSADFRVASGGISRVAHLMDEALHFNSVISLYGQVSGGREPGKSYLGGSRLRFSTKALSKILLSKFDVIAIDHLGVASVLLFVPDVFLNKVIIFLHDEEAWGAVKGRKRVALKKASLLLTNSAYTYRLFVENNPEFKDKTKVCLLGGVPEGFQNEIAREPLKYNNWFENHDPYLIFVSRLWKEHRYKGHWELLEAFNSLNLKEDFKLRLAIVGRGDDADAMEAYIKEHSLDSRIKLFKDISDHELALFYRRSLGLIFPSVREGFGFVFIEAMFFCKAAIGIAKQPAEEIIRQGETGILLKDNTVETLIEALQKVNADPERFSSLGNNAYRHYQENFSKKIFIRRFLNNINEGSVHHPVL